MVVILFLLAIAPAGHAANGYSHGRLTIVEFVGGQDCPFQYGAHQGQQIRVTGSGFASSANVDIQFYCCDSFRSAISTATANASGDLDAYFTIPSSGYSVPAIAMLDAVGAGSVPGETRTLTAPIRVGPTSPVDTDGDSTADYCDNCPTVSNDQSDWDRDGIGDACDLPCQTDANNDLDGDGLCLLDDPCPNDPDNDIDGDGVCGDRDNCPADSNPNQQDTDGNGIGEACQVDRTCSDGVDNDGDGVIDYPNDQGCTDADDTTETDVAIPCDDGIDNDFDALQDYSLGPLSDPGCGPLSGVGAPENPECDDGIDNDGDGLIDWDGDFGLTAPDPECGGVGWRDSESVK